MVKTKTAKEEAAEKKAFLDKIFIPNCPLGLVIMTREEAAAVMKLSVRHFDRFIKEEGLALVRIFSSVRIRAIDLADLLKRMSERVHPEN